MCGCKVAAGHALDSRHLARPPGRLWCVRSTSGSRWGGGRNPGIDPRRSRTFNLAAPFGGGVVVCGAAGEVLEEGRERSRGPYGDYAGVVDPDALEELADQLAALDRVGFSSFQKRPKSSRTARARSRSAVGPGAMLSSASSISEHLARYSVRSMSPIFVEVAEAFAALLEGAAATVSNVAVACSHGQALWYGHGCRYGNDSCDA
jgi:hypothetical protein